MDEGKKPGKGRGLWSPGAVGVLSLGILFGLPLYVYSRTLSPTVNFIDSGELISVAYHLGIAHPTGYPLYTLLGRCIVSLHSSDPASSLNFMSALFGSGAATLVGAVVYFAIRHDRSDRYRRLVSMTPHAVATASGLLFAFSKTMWQVSTQAEVYTSAIFLFVLLFLIAASTIAPSGSGGPTAFDRDRGVLIAFGYLWGLAMGNHMSVVLLSPLVLYMFHRGKAWEKTRRRSMICFAIAFLFGFSIYLYIPVRSMQGPILNWGHPADIDSFIRHITAWQYRTWMFTGDAGIFLQKSADYIRLLSGQFSPFILFLIPVGGFFLYRHRRPLLVALAIVFLSDLLYSLNYDIPDIDPYFIPSFVVIVVLAGAGLYQLVFAVTRRWRRGALVLTALSVVVPLSPIRSNYRSCDRSGDFMARELASNLLSTVSEGAVVLTRTWDLYAPVLYLQSIEGKRPDVVMIDYELMRRSWYVEDLMNKHGSRFDSARGEVDRFLDLVADFESGRDYDSRRLDRTFHAMLNAILLADFPGRSVYVDFDDNPQIAPALKKDPQGVIFQLREEFGSESFDITGYQLSSTLDTTIYRDERALWIRSLYPRYAVMKGIILRGRGNYAEAVESFEYALEFSRNDPIVLHLLGDTYFRIDSLDRARDCFRRLVDLNPADVNAGRRLGEIERLLGNGS